MGALPRTLEKLPFTLPQFSRFCWSSEKGRLEWEGRFERISRAWTKIEWLSVAEKIRPCCLLIASQTVLSEAIPQWEANRLSAASIPLEGMPPQGVDRNAMRVVVGNYQDVAQFKDFWAARDHDSIGKLLGYPSCCRKFFSSVWVDENCIDTTWFMAARTKDCFDSIIEIAPQENVACNILWRWMGIRAVPHLPCRFDCRESSDFCDNLLSLGKKAGFGEEVTWIREILSWPVEWSALHGIAEIKSPLLKLSTQTDATPRKYIVRWRGSGYPAHGSSGLRFPFQVPARPAMTQLKAFQSGFAHTIQPAPRPSWYHGDNGFSSIDSMERLHEPIVALAKKKLTGLSGRVLDLGCGNGVLLGKICDGKKLIPYGVDTNQNALNHARELFPASAEHFVEGNFFALESWNQHSDYVLTLLMLGRLKEVVRSAADQLIARLLSKSKHVLVYLYTDWKDQGLADMANSFGLQLEEGFVGHAGVIARCRED